MKAKLKKYFERMSPIITCAAALNPCFNVQGVKFLIELISTDLDFFDDSYATKAKKWFTDSFEAIPLSDEEIALDAASSEGFMFGPGSGGEEAEVEAEANYGYNVYHDDY
nr:squalene synthase [Tanacetum cinerariifolium]